MDTSADAFNAFAQEIDTKAQTPAEPVPEVAEPEQSTPEVAAPEPAAEPETAEAEAAPEPEAKVEEPQRDEKGRFIPVNRHKEILETARQPLQSRIAELESQLDKVKQQPQARKIEALEKLKEDFPPELIDAISGELVGRDHEIKTLAAKLSAYEASEQARAEQDRIAAMEEVQSAMDAVPTLKAWRENAFKEDASPDAKEMWEAAVAHDQALKQSITWANRPLQERFQRALQRAAEDLGVEVPEMKVAEKPVATQTKPLPPANPPSSISNIPSGRTPGAQNGTSEAHSIFQDFHATQKMSRDQMEKYFLRGGS